MFSGKILVGRKNVLSDSMIRIGYPKLSFEDSIVVPKKHWFCKVFCKMLKGPVYEK